MPRPGSRRLLHGARLRQPVGLADPAELIERQRAVFLGALRDLENDLADGAADVTTSLLVEGAALHLEADLNGSTAVKRSSEGRSHDLDAEDDRTDKLQGEGSAAVPALPDIDLTVARASSSRSSARAAAASRRC